MHSKDIIKFLECREKYRIHTLNIKSKNERYLYFSKAITEMSKEIAFIWNTYRRDVNACRLFEEKKEKIAQYMELFIENNYCREWFSIGTEYEKAVSDDIYILKRYLNQLALRPGDKVSAQVFFDVPFHYQKDMTIIQEVGCKADLLIIHADHTVDGVILHRIFPKDYSIRASKSEHKIINCIELQFLWQALYEEEKYEKITVSMVRLESRCDKNGEWAVFDGKEGDNTIQLNSDTIKETVGDDFRSHIVNTLDDGVSCDCNRCFHQSICGKFTNLVYLKEKNVLTEKKQQSSYEFTEEQRKCVQHMDGPMRVSAGPGSGKTAVLIGRIQYLMNQGVAADDIRAITFTKEAALEMKSRIQGNQKPLVTTIHALAYQILLENHEIIGHVKLLGDIDIKNLLMKVLKNAPPIQGENYKNPLMAFGLLDNLLQYFRFLDLHGKSAFLQEKKYRNKDVEGILKVKELYERHRENEGYITFDDQILKATELLQENPYILDSFRSSYQYLLVDEAQDIDEAQADFIRLIVPAGNNIAGYADSDQSVYDFRGASNEFFLRFPQIYPGTKDIRLEDNFRSTDEILKVSQSLIRRNQNRVAMRYISHRKGNLPVLIQQFQEHQIGDLIQTIKSEGYDYGDIAVIARKNNDLHSLCRKIDGYPVGIPYQKAKYYLSEDKVFKTLVDVLELAEDLNNDEAMYRLLTNFGFQPVKQDKSKSIYADFLDAGKIYAFDGEDAANYHGIFEEGSFMYAFSKIYRSMRLLKLSLAEAIPKIISILFGPTIDPATGEGIKELISERKLSNYRELHRVMKSMVLFRDKKRISYGLDDENRVHFKTAHDAKGREWPVVILHGIDAFDEQRSGSVEENRRILYVALTRAKDRLYITEICHGTSKLYKEINGYVKEEEL